MLRLLKQYYTIRNAIFVIGEGVVIYVSVLLAGVYTLILKAIIGQGIFFVSIGIVILLIVSWRFCCNIVIKRGLFNQKIILLGSGEFADLIANKIQSKPDCGYSIKMRLLEDLTCRGGACEVNEGGDPPRKAYSGLYEKALSLNTNKIVVALKERRGGLYIRELLKSGVSGVEVVEGTSFFEMLTGRFYLEHTNPGWFIFSEGFKKSAPKVFFKQVFDIFVSLILLVLLAPIILVVALLIKVDSRAPTLFSQERVGRSRKPYRVFKFRSMVADAEV